MSGTWQQLASDRRPAENRLIARYRSAFFRGEKPAAGRGSRTVQTPWGIGCGFFPGMYVAEINRRSAWPETQIVLNLWLDFAPDRRVVAMWPVWPPEYWHADEPPYNDVLYANLAEAIQKRAVKRFASQPGQIVYFIWGAPVDFEHPPAPGDPPPELMSARAEIAQIKSKWRSPLAGDG